MNEKDFYEIFGLKLKEQLEEDYVDSLVELMKINKLTKKNYVQLINEYDLLKD